MNEWWGRCSSVDTVLSPGQAYARKKGAGPRASQGVGVGPHVPLCGSPRRRAEILESVGTLPVRPVCQAGLSYWVLAQESSSSGAH